MADRYFAVRTEEGWKAAGGKHDGKRAQIKGKAVLTVAEAVNAVYHETNVESKDEVRQRRHILHQGHQRDLELLGIR